MRPYNFSAGPAMLPEEVLKQASAEMLDWQATGLSVMEMSHRSPPFESILKQTRDDLRELLKVPDTHHILFMQGGATAMKRSFP